MLRYVSRFLQLSVLAFLAACAPLPTNLPRGWDVTYYEPVDPTPVSLRVVIVADNQLHNVYADPVALRRTALANRVISTAIRPVQLDLYGPAFLSHVVDEDGARLPILHLGDACDLSCTGEYIQFCSLMRKAKRGWAMAPGNHDGYLYGNEQTDPAGDLWMAAAKNCGEPLTKARFIRMYLAALAMQDTPSCRAFADSLSFSSDMSSSIKKARELSDPEYATLLNQIAARIPKERSWIWDHPAVDDSLRLRKIAWRIDENTPSRSFVVQMVDITHPNPLPKDPPAQSIFAILLDSCQFSNAPTLIPLPPITVNSGVTGEILDDQAGIVDAWMDAEPAPSGAWALMSHHPYDVLTEHSRNLVDGFRNKAGIPFYVSAHTHRGHYIVHDGVYDDSDIEPDGKTTWLELNVGSIVDWPIEYRTLEFLQTRGRLSFRSERKLIEAELGGNAHNLLADAGEQVKWDTKPGDDDFALKVEFSNTISSRKTELILRGAMLASYHKRLDCIRTKDPTDPAIHWPPGTTTDEEVLSRIASVRLQGDLSHETELLLQLKEFDATRSVDVKKARKYDLSSALWASKYKIEHGRKPVVDDWFIVFPKANDVNSKPLIEGK